jgi:hypothetical protein
LITVPAARYEALEMGVTESRAARGDRFACIVSVMVIPAKYEYSENIPTVTQSMDTSISAF